MAGLDVGSGPAGSPPRWRERSGQSADLRPLLASIDCPALIVAGEMDFICGPAQAMPIASAVNGSRLIMLPGYGHIPSIEQPERYRHAVRDFLRTLT